jgi:UDP-glucose 4-epimerase
MKRVIVTGGAGFIGSNLAEYLYSQGYHVIILDDFHTGNPANISSILKLDDVEFIEGSIMDTDLLQRVFEGIDYIFHQAAIPSVPRSIDNPEASHMVNATGTLNVLQSARKAGVKKVVYASSSSVYGDTPVLPKLEDMPTKPMSPYAVSKLTGEQYCQVFTYVYGLPTASLRYFNVYGPKQDPNSQYAAVIPKFITRIARGESPIIYGDGEQSRDFTYIKDVLKANLLAATSEATGVYNIGRGERNTINRLVEIITNLMDSNIKPIYEKPRPGDVLHSLADITRARSFGYNPAYSLEEGLKETIDAFV